MKHNIHSKHSIYIVLFTHYTRTYTHTHTASNEETSVPSVLVPTITDCCTFFIDYQGVNMLPVLSPLINTLFETITKHLSSTSQIRDTFRNSYTSFLYRYFTMLDLINNTQHSKSLLKSTGVAYMTLHRLRTVLLSDEHLRLLITYAHAQRQTQGQGQISRDDLFVNMTADRKIRLNYAVTALVCGHCFALSSAQAHAQAQAQSTDNDPVKETWVTGTGTAESSSTKRRKLAISNSSETDATSSTSTSFEHILYVIQTTIVTSKSHYTSVKVSTTLLNNNLLLLESMMYLLLAFLKSYPDGAFLLHGERGQGHGPRKHRLERLSWKQDDDVARSTKLRKLCHWVRVIRDKLMETLSLQQAVQLEGVILLLLKEIANLSKVLLRNADMSDERGEQESRVVHAATTTLFSQPGEKKLLEELSLVLMALLNSDFVQRHAQTCAKNSLGECVFDLLGSLLSVVEPSIVDSLVRSLWGLRVLVDPRSVESPSFFSFLYGLTSVSENDIPNDFCRSYLAACQQLHTYEGCDGDLLDTMVTALTPVPLTHSEGTGGPHAGFVFLTLWLLHQLIPTNKLATGYATQLSVACCNDLARVADAFLCQALCPTVLSGGANPYKKDAADKFYVADRSVNSNVESDCQYDQFLKPPSSLSSIGSICFLSNSLSAPDAVDGRDRRDSRSSHWSSHLHRPNKARSTSVDETQFDTVVTILNRTSDKLHSLQETTSRMYVDPNNQLFFSWQVVCLLVISMYETVMEIINLGILNQVENRTDRMILAFERIKSECLERIYSLLELVLSFLLKKLPAIKIADRSTELLEYLNEVKGCIQRLANFHVPEEWAQFAQRSNKKCCEILLHILKLFQKESLNKTSSTTSSTSDLDVTAQRRNGGAGAIDMEEDDLMDDYDNEVSQRSNTSPRGRYHSLAVRSSQREDDDGPYVDPTTSRRGRDGSTLVSAYPYDLIKCFICVSQAIVLLDKKKRDTILKAVDLFGYLKGYDDSSVGSIVFTRSESYLHLAQGLASLTNIRTAEAVQKCINSCQWRSDWGPLGYCKVLIIVFELTKSKQFWLDFGPDEEEGRAHACATNRLETMISYFLQIVIPNDDLAIDAIIASLWQIRALQLECLSNFMRYYQFKDEIKNDLISIVVNAIADKDIRVRLTAGMPT